MELSYSGLSKALLKIVKTPSYSRLSKALRKIVRTPSYLGLRGEILSAIGYHQTETQIEDNVVRHVIVNWWGIHPFSEIVAFPGGGTTRQMEMLTDRDTPPETLKLLIEGLLKEKWTLKSEAEAAKSRETLPQIAQSHPHLSSLVDQALAKLENYVEPAASYTPPPPPPPAPPQRNLPPGPPPLPIGPSLIVEITQSPNWKAGGLEGEVFKPGENRLAAVTTAGRRPGNQQDGVYVDSYEPHDAVLVLVADGMGGYHGGEIASKLPIQRAYGQFTARPEQFDFETSFRASQDEINASRVEIIRAKLVEIRTRRLAGELTDEEALQEENKAKIINMGTTVIGALIKGDEAVITHSGDSRAYLLRNGSLHLVTQDHSPATESFVERENLRPSGLLSEEMSEKYHKATRLHPDKNVVAGGLGIVQDPAITVTPLELQKDDILIFCTDGVHDFLPFGHIRTIAKADKNDSAAEIARNLNVAALEAQTQQAEARGPALKDKEFGDNITVAVYKHEKPEAKKEAPTVVWSAEDQARFINDMSSITQFKPEQVAQMIEDQRQDDKRTIADGQEAILSLKDALEAGKNMFRLALARKDKDIEALKKQRLEAQQLLAQMEAEFKGLQQKLQTAQDHLSAAKRETEQLQKLNEKQGQSLSEARQELAAMTERQAQEQQAIADFVGETPAQALQTLEDQLLEGVFPRQIFQGLLAHLDQMAKQHPDAAERAEFKSLVQMLRDAIEGGKNNA